MLPGRKGPTAVGRRGVCCQRKGCLLHLGERGVCCQGEGVYFSLEKWRVCCQFKGGLLGEGWGMPPRRRWPTAAWTRRYMLHERNWAYCLWKKWGICWQGEWGLFPLGEVGYASWEKVAY